MKRMAALLLALVVMFSVTGCGKKSTCPMCSAEADFSTQIFCSNCGYDFGSMKPDGYEEDKPTPEDQAIYELAGTWKFISSPEEIIENGIGYYNLISFLSNRDCFWYSFTMDLSGNMNEEFLPLTYSIDNGSLTLSDQSGQWTSNKSFSFNHVSGSNIFSLDEDEYTRTPSNVTGEIWGTWTATAGARFPINWTQYSVYSIDFYKDGTYQFNKDEDDPSYPKHSGYYQIIHNGTAIVFDGDINSPFPISLPSNEIMIITDDSDMAFTYIGSN